MGDFTNIGLSFYTQQLSETPDSYECFKINKNDFMHTEIVNLKWFVLEMKEYLQQSMAKTPSGYEQHK